MMFVNNMCIINQLAKAFHVIEFNIGYIIFVIIISQIVTMAYLEFDLGGGPVEAASYKRKTSDK